MTDEKIVLGIETSCDETGVAIFSNKRGLLAEELHSQQIHTQYGGVVPEAASREHIMRLPALVGNCLQKLEINPKNLVGVAYTSGPGLSGALMTGAFFAKTLAMQWQIPALGIHHMEGHLMSVFIESTRLKQDFLALLVSGGHTQLVQVTAGKYITLGNTLDDAVGESFDKVGSMLGLAYPGGPKVAKLAADGNSNCYEFTRPLAKKAGLDFSFSGLKTQVRYLIAKLTNEGETELTQQQIIDIAASFEKAAVDSLVIKCKRALKKTKLQHLVVAGGVSANQCLRVELNKLAEDMRCKTHYPQKRFCSDNGVMIAYAGLLRLSLGQKDNDYEINIKPRWALSDLPPIL